MDFGSAWERLDHRFRRSLEQAWSSLGRRGLPVGAVIARDHEVVSAGRNRAYDPPGGPDPLRRTPLAHTEMNALACLPEDTDFAGCAIWSTHAPCAMCRAAINFTGLASTHYLAGDPSDESLAACGSATGADASLWMMVANVMFLHNVAWVGGPSNPIVARYARLEPEIAGLALRLLDDETFIRASSGGGDLPAGLAAAWASFVESNASRLARG